MSTNVFAEPAHGSRGASSNGKSPSRVARRLVLWGAVATAVLGLAALLLVLPVRFPSAVRSYASITTSYKWSLEKGTAGQLISHTFNYQTGMSDGFRVSNFTGGSSIFFSVTPSLKPGQQVAAGDTVGTVYSSDVQERLISLNGQLAAAERSLAVNATGAKSAVVEAAQQRLLAAKRRRDDYEPTVARTQALFDDHLLPLGEYDRVQSAAHALDDAISIAQAELQASQTGAKPEELALAETRIATIKDEINAISSRAAAYTIRAPIAGTVTPAATGDVLLTISATSQYVAHIPIRWTEYSRVAGTPDARVTVAGLSRPVHGRILALGRDLQVVSGQKVVIATASLDSPPDDLLPGSLVRCRIDCRPLAAIEYGRLFLHSIANSVQATGSF